MLEAARLQQLTVDRNELAKRIAALLPGYETIWLLRATDFHREPVTFQPGIRIKGKFHTETPTQALLKLDPTVHPPRVEIESPNSELGFSFLMIAGDYVQTEREPEPVKLEHLLRTYLDGVPAVISDFESLLKRRDDPSGTEGGAG